MLFERGAETSRKTVGFCTDVRIYEGLPVPALEIAGQFRELRKFTKADPPVSRG